MVFVCRILYYILTKVVNDYNALYSGACKDGNGVGQAGSCPSCPTTVLALGKEVTRRPPDIPISDDRSLIPHMNVESCW